MGDFCFVIMTHWTKSNTKQWQELSFAASLPGSLQRAICMFHVPLPSVKGSQNSPQHVSQSVHPWMAEYLLLKMWSETKGTSITWSLLETQFQASSQIYWTRICIWTRFASDFMHVQICHTLVYKTESTVKAAALEKIFPYNQESELLTTMEKTKNERQIAEETRSISCSKHITSWHHP